MVVWIALVIAFSPALLDLGRNFAHEPYDRSTLAPALLLLWCALRLRGQRVPGRHDGLFLILAGVILEVFGIVTNTWSLARFGIPLAVIGAARFTGTLPLRVAALALFVVPIPYFLIVMPSPGLETALASIASHLSGALGVPLSMEAIELRSGSQRLHLEPHDGGLILVPLLMMLGWFQGIRTRADILGTLMRMSGWMLAALPLQILALVIAGGLLAWGDSGQARFWLRDCLWPLIAVVGLGIVAMSPASPARRPAASPSVTDP